MSWESKEVLKMEAANDDVFNMESELETLAKGVASFRQVLQHHGSSECWSS